MNFVAIDFETANYARNSACSIGLVRCLDGKIVEEYHTLIRPPKLYFRPDFIDIHGILPSDVRPYQTFDAYWEKIHNFIGNATLVAHNAPFDRGVLTACLEHFQLPAVKNPWCCSFQTARKFFPAHGLCLANYKLNTVAEYFQFQFKHHDALEDARACALIMSRMCENGEMV